MKKIVFFPIELKSRELRPRLLMSLFALKKNYACFIGSKQGIFRATRHFSPGAYFYKSMNHTDFDHIKKIKKLKNNYFVIDEEGGFQYSSSKQLNKFITIRSSKKNVELIDRFFSWGKFDFEEWKKRYNSNSKKFKLLGSPRIDFWRDEIITKIYKKELNLIKNKFKENIVLVISSFVTSKKELNKSLKNFEYWFKFRNKKEKKNQIKQKKSDYRFFKNYLKMIFYVSKNNPNLNFVIRPHPNENINDWKQSIRKMPKNVYVDKNYDVTPWIYVSKYVIHNSSAVGMQTSAMKKNLITYRPKGFLYDRNFTNKLGIVVNSKYKLNKILRLDMKLNKVKLSNYKTLKKRFYNLGEKNFVSKKIIDEINYTHNFKSNINIFKFLILSTSYKFKDSIYSLLNMFIKSKKKQPHTSRSFFEKMSGGIKKEEILRFFKTMNNYNFDIKIIKFCNNCYFIYRKK